jgi:hypothetical protein
LASSAVKTHWAQPPHLVLQICVCLGIGVDGKPPGRVVSCCLYGRTDMSKTVADVLGEINVDEMSQIAAAWPSALGAARPTVLDVR